MIAITYDGTLLDDGVEFVRVEVIRGDGPDLFSEEAERTCPPRVGPTGYLLARWLLRHHDTDPLGNVALIEAAANDLGVATFKIRQAIKRGRRYGLWSHDLRTGILTVRRCWEPKR